MNKDLIPRYWDKTYADKIDEHVFVYQPRSTRGLAVLNHEAAFLFGLIDGKRNLRKIWQEAKKKDENFKFEDLEKIFNDFEEKEIIMIDGQTRRFVPTGKPRHLGVWLHLTNQCNLRCKYCYVCKSSQKMSWETAEKAAHAIIRDGKKHGFKKITFKFSGGECLLEFEMVLRIVQLARKICRVGNGRDRSLQLDFVVLTNGVLLTDKIARKLSQEKIRASVSLDGLGKYNGNRVFPSGKSSFEFVKRGIENLLKHKVSFNVSTTVTAQNVSNLPELTKWFLKKKIPFAFNFYRENPLVKEKLINEDQKLIKYLKQAYQIIQKNPPQYSLINGLLDRVNFKKPHLRCCGMGNSYIVVRHNGSLHSCQMTLENPIGSIYDKDLIETMRKGDFIKPKGLTVEGKNPCATCQWKYVCCGGCPLLTYEQKRSYKINSPYCAVYQALIPEVLKCEAKRLIKWS